MLQSNLNGEKKSKHVINKSAIYVDKFFDPQNWSGTQDNGRYIF